MHFQKVYKLIPIFLSLTFGHASFLSDYNITLEKIKKLNLVNADEVIYMVNNVNKNYDDLDRKISECFSRKHKNTVPFIDFDNLLFSGFEREVYLYISGISMKNLTSCTRTEDSKFYLSVLYFLHVYDPENSNDKQIKEDLLHSLLIIPPFPAWSFSADNVAKKLPNNIKTYLDNILGDKVFDRKKLDEMYEKSAYYKKHVQKN